MPGGCEPDARIPRAPCARTARCQSVRAATCHGQRIPTNPSPIPKCSSWPAHLANGRPFSADALTSREHHNDCENHFIVSDGGDVAKADGAEPGKDKVQGGAVAALWMERGQTRSTFNIE